MQLLGFLSQFCKLTKVADPTADGTTAVDSASVDMSGWDGVIFFTSYATAAAGNKIHAEQSSDDADADAFADLEGSEVDGGASDEDQYVDVLNPRERYVRCSALRGTSSVLGDIWALQYKGKSPVVDNDVSGTIVGKRVLHPAEGTK